MRSTRALILLTLALCGISARAQYPANAYANAYAAAGSPAPNPYMQGPGPMAQPQAGMPYGTGVHAGLNQAGQGLATAGQGLAQAGQAYVHAVGSGVKHVANAVDNHLAQGFQNAADAAKFVGGAVNTVNSAVAAGIKSIPQTIKTDYQNAQQSISSDIATAAQTAQALGQFTSTAMSTLPPITQAWNPNAWKQAYQASNQELQNAYASLSGTLTSVAEGIAAKYCTEATFTPSVKKPAKFTGHGFAITFQSPICSFNETEYLLTKTKVLNCVKPSIEYVKTPAKFTSKYKSAATFVGKSCSITKTFGQPLVKVLYVFNTSYVPSIKELTGRVTSEIKSVLGEAQQSTQAMTSQLHSFLGGMTPHLPNLGAGPMQPGPMQPGPMPAAGNGMTFQNLQQNLASYPSLSHA